MKYKYCLSVTCLLLSAAWFTSCSGTLFEEAVRNAKTETVEFLLPEYPSDTHPELTGWAVTVLKDVRTQTLELPADVKSFTVTLPKNEPVPLKAYPLTQSGDIDVQFFYPAGCVYPVSIQLSWQGGFEADILHTVLSNAEDFLQARRFCAFFNWGRLSYEIEQKINNPQYMKYGVNPWHLNGSRIISDITAGRFSVWSLAYADRQMAALPMYDFEPFIRGQSTLYTRYVPLSYAIPQEEDSSMNVSAAEQNMQETNVFLCGQKIIQLSMKKTGNPVLVITGIERYTYKR